ncbi:MAG: O-antigen ligase family protein, partial [Clostridia bacterium]|nr:O-antigen ligase family protein [Clostridia bacterium]
KLWKFAVFAYIICNTAFASQSYLMMLNSYALYFLLGISIVCIISSRIVKINLFLFSCAAFMVVLLFGNFYTTSSYAFSYTYDFFVCLCIVVCILNFVRSSEDVEFIFKSLMIAGIVLDFYVLSIYGSGFIDAIMAQTRVGEVAGNVNDVGLKSCYSALIALFFLLNEKNRKARIPYLLVILVGVFFSLVTASKKVLILLIIGFVFIFIFTGKKKNVLVIFRNTLIALIASAIVVFLIYNVKYFDYMRVRFDELFDLLINGGGNSSDQKRMRFLIEGFEVFLQKPFFGDGTAASFNYFDTYSHSNFLEIMMNHGMLGFVIYYLCYPVVIFRCFKYRKLKTEGLNLSYLCLFFYLSILVLSIALVYYTFIYYQIVLSVAAAYVLNGDMIVRKDEQI